MFGGCVFTSTAVLPAPCPVASATLMTRGCIAQASSTSMTILEPSGEGPKEERYVSTNQIRRFLQAVCSNIAEA